MNSVSPVVQFVSKTDLCVRENEKERKLIH